MFTLFSSNLCRPQPSNTDHPRWYISHIERNMTWKPANLYIWRSKQLLFTVSLHDRDFPASSYGLNNEPTHNDSGSLNLRRSTCLHVTRAVSSPCKNVGWYIFNNQPSSSDAQHLWLGLSLLDHWVFQTFRIYIWEPQLNTQYLFDGCN